jgi:molecular chaperone GrpE
MVAKKKSAKKPDEEMIAEPAAVVPDAEAVAQSKETETETERSAEEVIEGLTDDLADLEDRHLRLVAEFDNFRKRTVRERGQHTERAQAELARTLLESLDDLARVSEHGSTDHDAKALLEGVQLVEAKLLRALGQLGLRRIDSVGQPFNPEVHEALVTVSTSDPEEDDVVSQEIGRGYLFKDTLLRPSLVQVMKYRPSAGDGGTEGGC